MNADADKQALIWLDRMLQMDAVEREQAMQRLAVDQPGLHTQLERLYAASAATDLSQWLHQAWGSGAAPHGDCNADLQSGATLGDYRILRELGRGGSASVWLGERSDGVLKRQVAIKIPSRWLAGHADAERFARERDVLALLNHPHIARILDAGVAPSGQPFIVLEYVDGAPLTVACDQAHLDIRQRLSLFIQVLAAVDHAHKHLVVHRDLKPSNILVDAQGMPRLLDFGIAKLLDLARSGAPAQALTLEAGCALTPRYAAPEQLTGGSISTSTDVYALGMVLYELLTGTLPHADRQRSVADAFQAALHDAPVPPSLSPIDTAAVVVRGLAHPQQLRKLLAGDLDIIVLKALRKLPGDRYASAEHLAADLRRHLEHRPIRARAATPAYRARLFLQRHRFAAAAAGCGLLAALTLSATTWQQYQRGVNERERAEALRDFMFDLVDDAEADERHPDAEPTGRQMLEGAVTRARGRFAERPSLRGEILAELGHMYRRLGDDDRATTTIQEAVGLLEHSAPAGDPALNKGRAWLADLALARGDPVKAGSLASQAYRECQNGRECAKARDYAATVLSNVALLAGQADRALTQARLAVINAQAGFGLRDGETALSWLGLALVARRASALETAADAMDHAVDLARTAILRKSDRIDIERSSAVLKYDLGDFLAARDQLRRLLEGSSPPAEQAQQWRLLATTLLALGEIEPSLAASSRAMLLAPHDAGDPEWVLALQAHARALALLGATDRARDEMEQAVSGWQAEGYAANTMEVLRARRMAAEVLLRGGHLRDGLEELQRVADAQRSAGSTQAVELAATLDAIGTALVATGQPAAARVRHTEAGQLLARNLPPGHPFRQRNALYAAWAEASQAAGHAPLERIRPLANAYADRFPADSAWRAMLTQLPGERACHSAAGTGCALLL